jgi:predicted NBD/HSP70 family sugar kinase
MISDQEIEVLSAIQTLETPTRKRLARQVRRSTVSISSQLSSLLGRGLVEKSGKIVGKGGRPSTVYRLSPEVGCTIGVYMEDTVCHTVAVDATGKVCAERMMLLSLSGDAAGQAAEIVAQLSEELARLIASVTQEGRRVLAIGIGPQGMVDSRRGMWLHGFGLAGVEHVDLRSLLEGTLSRAVLVEDPARCLAHLAVSRFGRAETSDFFLLYLGSGVGAGLVLSGSLYRGNHGMAGEIGHLPVEDPGVRCRCGNTGCLETVASVPAILGRFNRRIDEGVISSLQKYSPQRGAEALTLEAIVDAAAGGDRLALSSLADIGALVGKACATMVMLYNPRTICIAGPAAVLFDYLREHIWNAVRRTVIPEMLADLRLEVMLPRPGDEAVGAAMLAAHWFWERSVSRDPAVLGVHPPARELFA